MTAPHSFNANGSTETSNTPSADSVLAAKGRSFHWARRGLSTLHAQRATRLYRLCRHIDDLADESLSNACAQQALFEVAASIRTGQSDDPVLQDGLALMRECDMDVAVFLDLITGVQSDLQLVRMPDLDALLRYCYQVAGTVGLMMCKVLDTDARAAFPHAMDLGMAMQLTNICRDIAADAKLDRRYLPATLVGHLSPAQLLHPTAAESLAVQSCVARLLDCADTYYQSGELGLSYLPVRARAGMLVAARVYHAIGAQIKAQADGVGSARVVVTPWRKAAITAQTLGGLPFNRFFWQAPTGHDPRLHWPLSRSPVFSAVSFLRYAA
jgi:phytoene synthase